MKPLALAVAAVLLAACTETDLEKRADAERAAHNQAMAARAASSTAAMSTVEAKPTAATPADLEMPPHATATAQHEWLQQLVGDWTFTCATTDGSFSLKGTESTRSVGGLWIVSEGHAQVRGESVQSVMNLGYDPESQSFVGTWFD